MKTKLVKVMTDRYGMKKCKLFEPLRIRGVEFKNRIFVSPMCQYSSVDGMATDWHMVHLGSRAVGGAACVIVEATAVEPEGRISPDDMGIWSDAHIEPFRRINSFIKSHGAVPAIQLAHAGRKASTKAPWKGGGVLPVAEGGWSVVGASAIPFDDGYPMPAELSREDIEALVQSFARGAKRALEAGFEMIELHNAHGYLLHSFLSPLSNKREDEFGGSFKNRVRFTRQVVEAIRGVIPDEMPLFLRISATDWVEGGWDAVQSVALAATVKPLGVDLIDCSSGAILPRVAIPQNPGYQVPFAEQIRRDTGIMTGAVGLITEAQQASDILEEGKADIVLLARKLLREPYWPLQAAAELGQELEWPDQYKRGRELATSLPR